MTVATVAAVLAWPASAAALGISNFGAAPANTAAGAHSAFDLDVEFSDPSDDVKDLTVHLPPGLVGNPTATSTCSQAQFAAGCPAATQVGTTSTVALGLGLLPVTASGEVYNLAPTGGEPARLGIVIHPPLATDIKLQSPITLRPGDLGLDSTLTDLPTSVQLLGIPTPIDIASISLTLFGQAGGNAFMTNPTSCQPATTTVEATSYASPASVASATASFTPTNCGAVPFTPGLAVAPAAQQADRPGQVAATLTVPDDQANVRRADVTLPVGTALSPGVGSAGLSACSDAAFGLGNNATAPSCPGDSQIGDVTFVTPLVGSDLSGRVFLGEPKPGQRMRLLVIVESAVPQIRVKLLGEVDPDPATGQLATTFDNLPQLPFSSFTLRFRGGDNAVLTAPPGCGTHTATARLVPWTGGPAATPSAAFDTVGCGAPTFAPTVDAAVSPATAGSDTALTLTVDRPDGDARLKSLSIAQPPGLVGSLGSIPACPVEQARAANCPDDSRVGSATALSGTGATPASLDGTVYLTGPVGDAPAGLAVVVPAKVGPIDLGNVVTIAEIRLRSSDGGIDVVTPDLPLIHEGVPLSLRRLQLRIDRDGFLRNATSCGASEVVADFTGAGGEQARDTAPYQATGCDRLRFDPKLSLRLDRSGRGPAARTVLELGPGQANAKRVVVTLPREVAPNLQIGARACLPEAFAAGACPDHSKVGTATARTPLLATPLSGPVLLLVQPNQLVPGLGVPLQGQLSLPLRGAIAFEGRRLQTVFDGLPDVPIGRFELTFDGGKDGPLIIDRSICRLRSPKGKVELLAHSGAARTLHPAIDLRGCPPRVSVSIRRLRGGGAALALRANGAGRRLKSLSLRLPGALRLEPLAVRRASRFSAGGHRVHPRLRAGSRSLGLGLRRSAGSLALRVGPEALSATGRLRRGLRVRVRLGFAGGGGVTLRPRAAVR